MTKVDIWNKALAMLPHDRRVTADDDGSTEALRCADAWDDARKSVICAAHWGFLVKATPVCKGSCMSGQPYKYFYPRPVGAVRLVGIFDQNGRRARANAYNGGLLSDCAAGSIRYIPDSEDYDEWPQYFLNAVVATLAAKIAGNITGSNNTTAEMEGKAAVYLNDAKHLDASELMNGGKDPDWIAKARNRTGVSFRLQRHDVGEDVYWT